MTGRYLVEGLDSMWDAVEVVRPDKYWAMAVATSSKVSEGRVRPAEKRKGSSYHCLGAMIGSQE